MIRLKRNYTFRVRLVDLNGCTFDIKGRDMGEKDSLQPILIFNIELALYKGNRKLL